MRNASINENDDLIDFDQIVADVAKKHKCIITEDDPILVTVSLNSEIIKAYTAATNKSLSKVYEQHSEQANALIKEAVSTACIETKSALIEAGEEATKELISTLKDLDKSYRRTRLVTMLFSLCASLIALSSAVFIAWIVA